MERLRKDLDKVTWLVKVGGKSASSWAPSLGKVHRGT